MAQQPDQLTYYKYAYEDDFTVIFKFSEVNLEEVFERSLSDVGFEKLDFSQVSQIRIDGDTYFVTINSSSSQFINRISNQNKIQLAKSEIESVHLIGANQVYLLDDKLFWSKTPNRLRWEVGLVLSKFSQDAQKNSRLFLARILSSIAAEYNIFSFFGVPVEEGLVVLNPVHSHFEFVLIDNDRSKITTFDGEKSLKDELELIRLTQENFDEPKFMKADELFSFLMNGLNYFSINSLPKKITKSVYEFSQMVSGVIYPEENFKPREAKNNTPHI
ncbi:hypothetical protein N9N67_05450 [Bacteriovoracaceae bacterium]|nr:hypothetical protein [Bacteriovoracaceae bacterium]